MGSSRLVWAPVVTSKPAAGIHNETPLTSPPSFCVCLIDCLGRVLRLRSLRGKECVGRLWVSWVRMKVGANESWFSVYETGVLLGPTPCHRSGLYPFLTF